MNELLQQMEEFEGVMIGATNFAENLDKAVLRRFTYKIKLDYLTDEGKGIFFRRYFKTRLTAAEKIRLQAGIEANNILNQQYEVIPNYPMPGVNGKGILKLSL